MLGRDGADQHRGEIRIARQQAAHRLHKQIAAFLGAHPAEASNGVAARQSGLRERRHAVGRRRIAIGIDTVGNDDCLALEERR